ncbi:uncharacterized protein RAG0_14983 [Rhynchosporium agropyri]|uniref:Alpha-ketoglutarate-dependent dioxygenase AlkB-like domain-containing protein n=1 Tax=Rhynchosporium agropyri TaxID=914238 RepID=A0A1E1LJC0_9HELO|nr:uncharacterized protein RAG0_14983 [Rhynchosporium agropyri]
MKVILKTRRGASKALTPPTSPPLGEGSVLKLPVSQTTGLEIEKIESKGSQPSTTPPSKLETPITPPPEPKAKSRKRAATSTSKKQPKAKKVKVQKAGSDDENSDAEDGDGQDAQRAIHLRPNLTADKPEAFSQPLVFAHTRGGLCDTVHQFKANSAGTYQNKIAGKSRYLGILCDGGVATRDHFDDQVVICTVGGGRIKNAEGQMVLKADHKPTHQLALSALESKIQNQPVVVCIGQSNTKFPVKLDAYYNVLGYFHITDVWYDRYEKSCWVIRLEAVDLLTRPAWSVKALPFVPSTPSATRAPVLTCSSCSRDTKEIYTVGWFCMTPKCDEYYLIGGELVPLEGLQYTQIFLGERSQFMGQVPTEIAPVFPTDLLSGEATVQLNAEIKQGFLCPVCGCCCRRLRWNHFSCETPSCLTVYKVPRKVLTVPEVLQQKLKPSEMESHTGGGVTSSTMPMGGYMVDMYAFPDANGNQQDCYVYHFRSNEIINSQPNGSDELFASLQQEDLDLKRQPVKTGGHVVEMVTNNFTKNFGSTYKWFVPQDSDSFEASPDVVLRVLMRNTWAANSVMEHLEIDYMPPNELLLVGYQKKNQMKFHDDGESTLGPTVTSLSLGGGAVMKWRRKKVGAQKASLPILQIYLQHGDFMVMSGVEFQRQFEHAVIPDGDLRFAITTRTILCERISDPKERAYAIKSGIIPARASEFEYDGDMDLSRESSGSEHSSDQEPSEL